MLRLRSLNGDSLAANCTSHEKCPRFDPVWDHLVFRPVQLGHPFNYEASRSSAFDLCAHLVQKIREIHYFRLLCRALNNGHTVSEHSGHHHIVGAQDCRTKFALHIDYRSRQSRSKDFDVATFHAHRGPKCLETFQMQINRSIANDATAWQGDGRFFATAQQWPEHTNRSAHFANDVVRRYRSDVVSRYAHRAAGALHLRTQMD